MRFALLHFFGQLWQDGQNISHHTQIGGGENGRVLVLVDRYDIFRTFHAGQMLNRAADTTGDVERWLDRLAGLADLIAVGQPARVDNRAGRAWRAAQGRGQILDQLVILRLAQAAPAADDHSRFFQCRSLARDLDAIQNLDGLRGAVERDIERLDLGGVAFDLLYAERFGPRQHNTGATMRMGRCDNGLA